jgi:hypothetical protein
MRLQGIDLALRVITQQTGRFSTYYREFPYSEALYLNKINKSTIEPRGTMLAEGIKCFGINEQ